MACTYFCDRCGVELPNYTCRQHYLFVSETQLATLSGGRTALPSETIGRDLCAPCVERIAAFINNRAPEGVA